MFVSVELATRIEQAESRLSAALGRAMVARKTQSDAFVDEIGGGVAVYTGPSSPMNKMIGVGFGGPLADDQLQAIEEKFARRGAPFQVEMSTLADPAVAARLTLRGYVLQGFENVLGRRITSDDADPRVDPAVDITVMKHDLARWLDVALTAFLCPEAQGVQAETLPPRELLERALRD